MSTNVLLSGKSLAFCTACRMRPVQNMAWHPAGACIFPLTDDDDNTVTRNGLACNSFAEKRTTEQFYVRPMPWLCAANDTPTGAWWRSLPEEQQHNAGWLGVVQLSRKMSKPPQISRGSDNKSTVSAPGRHRWRRRRRKRPEVLRDPDARPRRSPRRRAPPRPLRPQPPLRLDAHRPREELLPAQLPHEANVHVKRQQPRLRQSPHPDGTCVSGAVISPSAPPRPLSRLRETQRVRGSSRIGPRVARSERARGSRACPQSPRRPPRSPAAASPGGSPPAGTFRAHDGHFRRSHGKTAAATTRSNDTKCTLSTAEKAPLGSPDTS